ncbi:MAG: hypothetical protein N4A76_11180 [Firmicutes bacterium]|jgi:hypothetical protein|nr:hypothetical protein [Bacillota bacterium]
MKSSEYFELIEKRLGGYFDFVRDFPFDGVTFDLKAISNVRNEKYFAFKEATLYAYENNEILLFKYTESMNEDIFDKLSTIMKDNIAEFVDLSEDHMSSVINCVILINEDVEEQLVEKIKKFKYHKSFSFGFKGWADMMFTLVNLKDGRVYNNKKLKRQTKLLLPL